MTSDPTSRNQFYGWFDDASQAEPTYDPPHDAPCILCGRPLVATDVRTHCLMFSSGYARRSYFYRTHRTCAETRAAPDGHVLDMIEQNGD